MHTLARWSYKLGRTPHIEGTPFIPADWTEFYHDAKEDIQPNATEPKGKPVVFFCF
jgi:hypothetical protein